MSTGGSSRTTSAERLSVLVGALSVPAFVGVWELIARSRIVNAGAVSTAFHGRGRRP
ncbi:hypothetical protein ACVW0W_003298 [Bradyrhizobium sp. USDA 4469]